MGEGPPPPTRPLVRSWADRFINAGESRHVAKQLGLEAGAAGGEAEQAQGRFVYWEYSDRDHFFEPFQELEQVGPVGPAFISPRPPVRRSRRPRAREIATDTTRAMVRLRRGSGASL